MNKKALFFSFLSLIALHQTTHSMSILNALEDAHTAWNNKSTPDKVKLGLYTVGGAIAAKFVYNWTIGALELIKDHKQKLMASARKIDARLKITDLFFIKDIATRHKNVKEYFTQNPEMINESCVYPHSPKAPARKPLYLALFIKDYELALWLMENGAQAQEGWEKEKIEQELLNRKRFENFMDEYCLPYSGEKLTAPEYGTIEIS